MLWCTAILLASACGPAHPAAAPHALPLTVERTDLLLEHAALVRSGIPEELVLGLARHRFSYFRMLAEAFELRTCEAFRDVAGMLPTTAVHGDAHIEQFAVTGGSYGLEDYDRGGYGPAVVDLVRYAASLHVACADVAWPCDSAAAIERFLTAYRAALTAEPAPRPPAIVHRLRAKAAGSRALWLSKLDKRLVPLGPALEADLRRGWAPFAKQMQDLHPERPPAELDLVRLGRLRLGLGSFRERKVLIRVAGPTRAPEDDAILEAREAALSAPRSCVWRGAPGQSPVWTVMALVGRRMPELYGFAAMLGPAHPFWVQSWDPQYVELSLEDIASQAELEELAGDAGRQLAGALWPPAPDLLHRYQRYAHAAAFDETRPRVVRLALGLAQESNRAWERFRTGALQKNTARR